MVVRLHLCTALSGVHLSTMTFRLFYGRQLTSLYCTFRSSSVHNDFQALLWSSAYMYVYCTSSISQSVAHLFRHVIVNAADRSQWPVFISRPHLALSTVRLQLSAFVHSVILECWRCCCRRRRCCSCSCCCWWWWWDIVLVFLFFVWLCSVLLCVFFFFFWFWLGFFYTTGSPSSRQFCGGVHGPSLPVCSTPQLVYCSLVVKCRAWLWTS